MKLCLALDCSTAHGGVALGSCADGKPPKELWHQEFSTGRGRGGEMFTALQTGLRLAGEADHPLESILVGLGPGSYSGVRQAIAAAVGISLATGARLRGVPSVLGLDARGGTFQAVGDARRGTYYYTAVRDGVCVAGPELLENREVLEARLAARADWPLLVTDTALPDGVLSGAAVALPDARRLLWAKEEAYYPPPLEPIYLRPVSITLPKHTR